MFDDKIGRDDKGQPGEKGKARGTMFDKPDPSDEGDDKSSSESETDAGEKPAPVSRPSRFILPKLAKMWTVPPNQKFVLPRDLNLQLPPDMPVVPGIKPLTPEQIEQLRALLHQQNLKQMKGLTKEQLKKILDARKDSERARPTESSSSSAPVAADRKRETPRPAAKPKPRQARTNKKPRELIAGLPPGLTSPFRYKPWTPAWRQRYAALVKSSRTNRSIGSDDKPQTTRANQPDNPMANASSGQPSAQSSTRNLNQSGDKAAMSNVPPSNRQKGLNGQAGSLLSSENAAHLGQTSKQSNGQQANGASNPANTASGGASNATNNAQPDAPSNAPNAGAQANANTAAGSAQSNGQPSNNQQSNRQGGILGSSGANGASANGASSNNVPSNGAQSTNAPAGGTQNGNGGANGQSATTQNNNSQNNGLLSGSQTGRAAAQPGGGAAGSQTGKDNSNGGQSSTRNGDNGNANNGQSGGLLGGQTGGATGNAGSPSSTGAQNGNAGQNGSTTQGGSNSGSGGQSPNGSNPQGNGAGMLGGGQNNSAGGNSTNNANNGQQGSGQVGGQGGLLGGGQSGGNGQSGNGSNNNQGAAGNQGGAGGLLGGQGGNSSGGSGQGGNSSGGSAQNGNGNVQGGGSGAGSLIGGSTNSGGSSTGSGAGNSSGAAGSGGGAAGGAAGGSGGGGAEGGASFEGGGFDLGVLESDSTGEMADIIGDINSIDTGYTPAQGVAPNPPEKNSAGQGGLSGALVLPPLPPLGTESGKNPTPLTVKTTRRVVKPMPVEEQLKPQPEPRKKLVVMVYRYSRQVPDYSPINPAPAPRRSSPPVAPRTKPDARPSTAPRKSLMAKTVRPKVLPPALSVGSTSTRGTVVVAPMKQRRLPLGAVAEAANPQLQLQARRVTGRSQTRRLASMQQAAARRGGRSIAATKKGEKPSARQTRTKTVYEERYFLAEMVEKQPEQQLQKLVRARPATEKKAKNSKGIKEGSKNPLPPTPLPDSDAEIGDGSGLKGEYFLGRDFDQYVFTRADPNIEFYWEAGDSPNPRLPAGSDWCARWTGKVEPLHSETYTFYASADDGVRVWVNHKLVIDDWTLHPNMEYSGTIKLEKGKQYDFRVDYFESAGGPAAVQLYWESPSQAKEFVPSSQFFYPLAGDKAQLDKDEPPHR